MCLTSEVPVVPVLALVIEAGAAWTTCLSRSLEAVVGKLVGGADGGLTCVDVLAATYGDGGAVEAGVGGGLCCRRLRLRNGQGNSDSDASMGASWAAFSSLESALASVGELVLRRPGGSAPVLVIHVTGGRFRCCAEVERAAGTVKMACDFRGAPSIFYNILVSNENALAFPGSGGIPDGAAPVVKTLHRMASPVGEWGASILASVGGVCFPGARYFEAVPVVEASLVFRFAGAFFSDVVREARAAMGNKVRACAFVMPKEGEMIDKCEDVVSVHRSQRRFAVSDGATTASYSAEWARALCRHAVESPPPSLRTAGCEAAEEDMERLRAWLGGALEYWAPEVPWERLVRPSLFNKAKEGSGASLAGVEILEDGAGDGVRFRAWALGDSCVIQLRGDQIVSSRPMDASAKFSHVPRLLMTVPGYEAKYVRFWQNWESVLATGDVVLLGTDALCEYILKAFESGGGGEVLAWIAGLRCESGGDGWGRFEEFVAARRKDGQMKNDDVGLIILGVRQDGRES